MLWRARRPASRADTELVVLSESRDGLECGLLVGRCLVLRQPQMGYGCIAPQIANTTWTLSVEYEAGRGRGDNLLPLPGIESRMPDLQLMP
jgi:hypothetical protein